MPQYCNCGTCPRLNTPDTQLDEVPTMASYQPPHSLTLIHPGAIASGPLSTSLSHPAQHQGELDSISAPPQPTQTPAANEAEEDMG